MIPGFSAQNISGAVASAHHRRVAPLVPGGGTEVGKIRINFQFHHVDEWRNWGSKLIILNGRIVLISDHRTLARRIYVSQRTPATPCDDISKDRFQADCLLLFFLKSSEIFFPDTPTVTHASEDATILIQCVRCIQFRDHTLIHDTDAIVIDDRLQSMGNA
jgi:hypothetical protein